MVSNVFSDKYPSSYTVFLYMSSEHSVFKGALTGHGSLRWIKESEIDKKIRVLAKNIFIPQVLAGF